MKIRYFLVTLFVCITLVSCGKKGINEDVVYDASTSSEKVATNSKDSSINIQHETPKSEKSEDSKIITAEGVKKIIFDSIQLAKDTNKFEASEGYIDESVNEYISDVSSYVNNVVNESLDLSSIGSENIDIQGITSFVESVVKTALSKSSLESTKDDLIAKNNSIPKSEYDIDLLYSSVMSNNQDLVLKIILSNKVDINSKNSEGEHILSAALVFNNCEIASLLLQAGANPYELNSDGISFYDQVMSDNSLKMKEIFSKYSK